MPDRMSDVAFEKEMARISNTDLAVNSTPKVTVQETVQPATKATLPAKKPFVTRGIEINTPVEKTKTTEQPAQTKTTKRSETIIEVEQPVKEEKGTSYFLVHSSYTSIREAANTIESLKKEGFKNLVMIDARGKYRVALGIYTTEAAAKVALRKNYPRFDQLKIYNF
jgi:cell division protein FtsN